MVKKDEFKFARREAALFPWEFTDFHSSSGVRSDLDEFEPSLTRQEFTDECDINTIMSRYEATGVISHVNHREPVYLDTSEYPGLQASMDLFRQAEAAFAALPAQTRRQFDNDPQKFVDFAVNKENLPQMREWGLAAPEKEPLAPMRVEVVNPLPPAEKAP